MSATIPDCGCDCAPNQDPCAPCGGAIGITTLCRIQTGSATLCGNSEYTTPSTPPKKYLKRELSGSMTVKSWNSGVCGVGALQAGTCIVQLSGVNSFSPTAGGCGSETIGATATTEGGGGGGPSTNPCSSIGNVFCALSCNGAEVTTINKTRRTRKLTFVGGGTGCVGGCEVAGDEATEQLSDEDTEQTAMARSAAAWSDWQPLGFCCAGIELRTSGFTFGFQKAEQRITLSGPPGRLVNIDVPYSRVPYGSTGAAESFFDTYQIAIGPDGTSAPLELTIPNARGWSTCALNPRLSADQPVQ
jgi:hypothetical protein